MKYLSLAILFVLPACSGDEFVPFDPFATDIDFGGGNPFTPPTQAPPGSGGGGGGTPPPAPIPPGTTTDRSIVSKVTPPIGLTLYIGMAENVTMAAMQGVYSQFASVNTTLWNMSEGQVYIYKMVISDGVAEGTTPAAWEANKNNLFNSSNLDIVVWPASSWNLGGAAGVVWWTSSSTSFGRFNRLMLIPDNASGQTRIHETSHQIWGMSWPGSFGLDDEYIDGIQDAACVMESNNSPVRWCSMSNHVNQSSQPHSCWTQILLDYPLLTHGGTDTATTNAWVPIATYTDKP